MPPSKTSRHVLTALLFSFSLACGQTSNLEGLNGTKNTLVVQTGATPDWVEPLAWTVPEKSAPVGAAADILLSDAQNRLTPDGCSYYFRQVIRLLNPEGVRSNSEQSVEYSPEFEHVTWHTLRVIRGTEIQDRLPTAKFEKLQRERQLEEQIFSGRITAATVLGDMRVGDILEVAYTFHSANPLLRGYLSSRNYLGSAYPIALQSVIVRTPATEPPLAWSFFVPPGTRNLPGDIFRAAALRVALTDEIAGTDRVYRWKEGPLPGIIFDEAIPARAAPYYPMLRSGSMRTWAEVVSWAEPIFSGASALPDTARELVKQWKTKYPDPGQRLNAAVRWVQDDIRYFAMAIGEHNLRPRPLAEVCSSRFGDCKDKAVLLAALLRELGIEAWPALVNTYWQDRIREYGPSPLAFNHAIIAYNYEGRLRWLDPTIKRQQGAPGTWAVPPYRLGLILRADESDLTAIPGPEDSEPDTLTSDTITFDSKTNDALLATQVTLRGLQADYYRQSAESATAEQIAERWFNFIARFYKKIREESAPVIEDDLIANQIIIRARYRIPDLLQNESDGTSVSTYAYALRAQLDPPQSRRRRWPYPLPSGRFLRHRIEIELPFDLQLEAQPQVISTGDLEYRVDKGISGRRMVTVHDLRFTGDFVAADRMEHFCDAVDEILVAMGTTLHRSKPVVPTTGLEPKLD